MSTIKQIKDYRIPMKKNHSIFVWFLFKPIRKLYNYCSFLNKNYFTIFFNVLKTCDFHTIQNKSKFKILKTYNICTIKNKSKFLVYNKCVSFV